MKATGGCSEDLSIVLESVAGIVACIDVTHRFESTNKFKVWFKEHMNIGECPLFCAFLATFMALVLSETVPSKG